MQTTTELFSANEATKELFDTKESAKYLGLAPPTLRNARHSGKLAGVDAPVYRKIGTAVRYERAALDRWLSQFPERTSTRANA